MRRRPSRKLPAVRVSPGVRLWHVKNLDPGIHSGGHITVAARIDPLFKTVALGFSFCSPTDEFEKRQGALRALGRLWKFPIVIRFYDENPIVAIKTFVVHVFTQGVKFARDVFAHPISRKKDQQRIEWFLKNDLPKHPTIVSAPYQATKKFPIRYPWWWTFSFPLQWQPKEREKTGTGG